MTPPLAIALHASKVHHKIAALIQSDPPQNEKGDLRCETEANGNETGQEMGVMSGDGGREEEEERELLAG